MLYLKGTMSGFRGVHPEVNGFSNLCRWEGWGGLWYQHAQVSPIGPWSVVMPGRKCDQTSDDLGTGLTGQRQSRTMGSGKPPDITAPTVLVWDYLLGAVVNRSYPTSPSGQCRWKRRRGSGTVDEAVEAAKPTCSMALACRAGPPIAHLEGSGPSCASSLKGLPAQRTRT